MKQRTRKDAMNWVDKAIEFYKASGKEIALAEFMNPKGAFVEDEMYIFVLDLNGIMLAHGVNEKFVGKDFTKLKDSDGKSFIREIIDTANTTGGGWTEYKWFHPTNKTLWPKVVYFEKIDDMIICTGIYKE